MTSALLSAAGNLSDLRLVGADVSVAAGDLLWGSSLGGALEKLRGRSVLVATNDQLTAALALIELDGVARRIVLCPPDMRLEHVPSVVALLAWMLSCPMGYPRSQRSRRWIFRDLQPPDRARRLQSKRVARDRMDPPYFRYDRRTENGSPHIVKLGRG